MMTSLRIRGILTFTLAVFLLPSCRTASMPQAASPVCEDQSLTSHPALVVFAPHPDDETLGFAGLVDAYLRQGKPVRVFVTTDGDAYCEACRFWKSSSVSGPTCTAEELIAFGEMRRRESTEAANILGLPAPVFLRYPDTGLDAAWRNFGEGKLDEPLRRSDFGGCTSCETCGSGYGQGPRTELSANTLIASLREAMSAAPDGALLATTHWLDGHGDHAGLGHLVRRLNAEHAAPHPVAYAVIHAHTPKDTPHSDCWYPTPQAPLCPCMDEKLALADPAFIDRMASTRFKPSSPAALPDDAEYGEETQLCLPERLYAGDDAVKLRAVRAYASQLGRVARQGSHPAALDGIMDCSGYLISFVRSTEAFVLEEAMR